MNVIKISDSFIRANSIFNILVEKKILKRRGPPKLSSSSTLSYTVSNESTSIIQL